MSKDIVSVVVPIYNVENYLERCLISIVNQKYSNLQIILVDDGSTDGSGKICDEWAQKDERIVVVHQNNGGLSAARNTGLERATGKYICFIDSDDFISVDYVSVLYELANKHDADVTICAYEKGTKEEFSQAKSNEQDNVFTGEQMLRNWHGQHKHIETVAWNKLYLRELFMKNEIRYPLGYNNEDVVTTHLLIATARRVVITYRQLYYYFQRSNSIMKVITEKSARDYLFLQQQRMDFFQKEGCIEAFERLAIKYQKYLMLCYCSITKEATKLRNELLEQYGARYKTVLGYGQTRKIDAFVFVCFKWCPNVVDWGYRVIGRIKGVK